MLVSNFITAVFGLLVTSQVAVACSFPRDAATDPESPLVKGKDGPADPATLGYTMNHFGLTTRNITAIQWFYGEVLGMRHIFTFHASEKYDIVYMGYSQGGKNGTGFQTGEELFFGKTNTEGLLEIVFFKDKSTDKLKASTEVANTFSHIGMVVPDIKATEERMKAKGVKIIKPLGEEVQAKGPVANAYGLGKANDADGKTIIAGLTFIGFKDIFLLVEDPDGNVVEFQPQS